MANPERFDGLIVHAFGDDAPWARAIMMVESGGNEYALGDDGEAHGLFQLHVAFALDWAPLSATEDVMLAIWQPAFQVAAVGRFWSAHKDMSAEERCLIFHYGAKGHLEHADDPDRYVMRVKALLPPSNA